MEVNFLFEAELRGTNPIKIRKSINTLIELNQNNKTILNNSNLQVILLLFSISWLE